MPQIDKFKSAVLLWHLYFFFFPYFVAVINCFFVCFLPGKGADNDWFSRSPTLHRQVTSLISVTSYKMK